MCISLTVELSSFHVTLLNTAELSVRETIGIVAVTLSFRGYISKWPGDCRLNRRGKEADVGFFNSPMYPSERCGSGGGGGGRRTERVVVVVVVKRSNTCFSRSGIQHQEFYAPSCRRRRHSGLLSFFRL